MSTCTLTSEYRPSEIALVARPDGLFVYLSTYERIENGMGAYKQSRLDNSGRKREAQSGGKSVNRDSNSIEWVRYTFSPDEKARIRETPFDVERFFDTLASMVERGHKFSVSPRNSNGFVGASIYGHTDECPNRGFGVSGEGGSLDAALKSLYWKLELLQYDLRTTAIDGEDDFR